jgi:hypothetical protein
MMVFGKQNTAEILEKSNSISSRSFHLSINERRTDESSVVDHDNSSTAVTKLYPIQSDNMSMNLSSRYDISVLNRSQTIVRDRFCWKFDNFI